MNGGRKEEIAWWMNLGGGSRRRFISSVALVVDYSHRWLPFVDYSHRWLPSTNLGGSPRRTTIVRNTFVVSEGMKKEPKDLREILSFFTRKNFNGTDRGETITNNGSEERRRCFAHDLFMYKLVCSRSEFDKGNPNEHLIKLRPFLDEFLREANKLFYMYVYTMGTYRYAQNVLSLIDPDKLYFGDRVITREKSPHKKTLDLLSADKRRVVIVDDTSSVWPQHKRNLLEIAKYIYFRDGMKWESYAEKKRDESRSKGALSNVLKLLQQAHRRFQDFDSNDLRLLIRDPCTLCCF
ncbi:hypothetical protein HID58_052795 [Brassica napus]|uniref:RNA polymerase II C-terminal domain phosphatase-like n=1 Tax=Brassica napus TaxID=3708 RepID=A0ABQ8ACV8_BRANA|nr:hypothetical protein HID58_052795 [Brassica napus]